MTSIQKLTTTDLLKLQGQAKVFSLQHFLFLIFTIVISLVSGLFGLKSFGYWICVTGTFSFMMALYLIMFIKEFIAFRKDIKQRQKVCATLTVTNKSNKKNDFVFNSDLKQLRKVNLFNRKIYEQVAIGDQLYVEFTKQSKQLLRLEKDGHNLLEDVDRT
jgi:hypothetical protein